MKIRQLINKVGSNRFYAGMKDGKPVFHPLYNTPEQDAEIKHYRTDDHVFDALRGIEDALEPGARLEVVKHYIKE